MDKVARARAVPLTEEQLLAVPWSEHQLLTKHEVAASTVIRKLRFLREFAECGIILRAAQAAHVSRQVIYNWRHIDPNFNDLMADAAEDALDRLEEEARRRAADGVEEPVFQAGKEVGRIRRYSDHLLMMFLKGKRRADFSERTETTGPNGSPLSPTVVMVSWHASMKPPEQP